MPVKVALLGFWVLSFSALSSTTSIPIVRRSVGIRRNMPAEQYGTIPALNSGDTNYHTNISFGGISVDVQIDFGR